MIYPERMERVVIVGPKTRLKAAIETLHALKIIHIIEHRKDQLDIGNPLPGSAQLSDQLIKVRSIMHSLVIGERDEPPAYHLEGNVTEHITHILEVVAQNQIEQKRLQDRLARLRTADGASVEKDREAALRAMEANVAARERIREQEQEFLYAAERFLTAESRKAQTPLRFAVSKSAFLINGWVPTKNSAKLRSELERTLEHEVHIETIQTREEAPVKLDNNEVISPYETLLKLYTLPKYNEIDPTTFIFLSFPFFFGFILGDIGYGLVLLSAFLIAKQVYKYNKLIQSVATILIASAVSSIVFGFVFGEIFGAEEIFGYHLPYLIHRGHDIMSLLLVSLAVGVLHIVFALIIGFVQEAKRHGGWKAFCAKASWLILLVGAGLIAAESFFGINTQHWGYVLGSIAIVLILIGEGARGLIELPGIFSNIASYARLMAVGVASAGLAVVVNELASSLFASGGIANSIIAVLVLIIGHIINIALGILGSFIHGLRLNYVEFFGKFYEGGGRPYRPFGEDE